MCYAFRVGETREINAIININIYVRYLKYSLFVYVCVRFVLMINMNTFAMCGKAVEVFMSVFFFFRSCDHSKRHKVKTKIDLKRQEKVAAITENMVEN